MPRLVESVALQLRVARRLAPRRGASLGERLGRLDDRLVFIVGSPRSGTTFLGDAIGRVPGFLDLGEVAPLKAAIPELTYLQPEAAAIQIRRTLRLTRRLGLVGAVRAVEQTPEMAFLIESIPIAFPESSIVHIVRDGRDVSCSLLAKGWLTETRSDRDDAGIEFGSYARFWVEPDLHRTFSSVSDARRAAWAWRRYVSSARSLKVPTLEIRYEHMVANPAAVAEELGAYLNIPTTPLAAALARAREGSVGRYRADLSEEQLADVLDEAGDLLLELGYLEPRPG